MPEAQMPIGAPPQAGTTPVVPKPPAKNLKRKPGRPRKNKPAPAPKPTSLPATKLEDVAHVIDCAEIKNDEAIEKELRDIRARLDTLEAKNVVVEDPMAGLNNLERAELREQQRKQKEG